MEQCKKSSPRTRHIHSSFPHYFYSTPAGPPSSGSITAFVDLCESQRLAADADDFASSNRHVPPPAAVAFADDLFRGGKLLPTEEAAAAPAQPLKPPPRLQYIANIRKSLRYLRRSSRGEGGGTKAAADKDNNDMRRGADPFAAAADKVAKEDAPWCQLPWRRKSNAAPSPPPHEAKPDDEERSKSRKENWIFRLLRSALQGKESHSSNSSDSKEEDGKNGQLVGLVRSTTVSRYRTTQYGSRLFYCFGFK